MTRALKMQAGDVVCIFRSMKVPFILWRVIDKDIFKLIGEAYVHGLIQGEHLICDPKFKEIVLV